MLGYRNLLVAVNFNHDARALILRAQAITDGTAHISLLHVVPNIFDDLSMDVTPPLPLDLANQLEDNARASLHGLAEAMNIPPQQCHVETGSAPNAIITTARQLECDLILVGSHVRHGLEILLGSTATGVLHGSPCDVLAVQLEKFDHD